jgi:hypothetical protein
MVTSLELPENTLRHEEQRRCHARLGRAAYDAWHRGRHCIKHRYAIILSNADLP